MSGYISLLLLIIGASLIAVVGILGLIFLEVKRIRNDRQPVVPEELISS